jgi:hypothetical protein
MYWKLFEELYDAHAKRKAVERCYRLRDAMIGGVWGNSNYDPQKEGSEGARKELLAEIEDNFSRAIREIVTGEKQEDDIPWESPFFAAMKSPRMRTEDAIETPLEEQRGGKKHHLEQLDQT